VAAACAGVPQGGSGAGVQADDAELPVGLGRLTEREFSLRVRQGALEVRLTPLAENVIRLAAPDTYQRLSALVRRYRPQAQERIPDGARLFLVSMFSRSPDVTFEPEDVHLFSRGTRYDPVLILPLTPEWGLQRLQQEETQSAVYAFGPGIDLEVDLVLDYRGARDTSWDRILSVLRAERARVRARGGD